MGKLTSNVQALYIYDEEDNCTHFRKCRLDKVAEHLGLTYKAMMWSIYRHRPFANGQHLYKLCDDDTMELLN